MPRITIVLGILMAAAACAAAAKGGDAGTLLASDARANARIVIPAGAAEPVQYAAEELRRWLGEISGAEFAIVEDSEPAEGLEIVIGQAHRRDVPDTVSLGPEDYLLRANPSGVWIAGGGPRGTLYGVYGLLEDYLGCRWFTPEVHHIPRHAELRLPHIDERRSPVLEYREPFTADCFDGDWAARNRMNGHSLKLGARHGGGVSYVGFVHTFDALVPPEKYFDEHPEYFALVNGKRLKDRTQLCCTNEDVIRIVTEEIRNRMRANPDAMVFSVSQNDWYNFCTCGPCAALAKAEDAQIAPVLALVNRVADAVAEEFPDKAIDTLAYQWTRKPPKTMRPRPNVIIRLCSIECCFAHSFEECDSAPNKAFVRDVKGWSTMCDRLWVWDYVTSFSNYFTPFPNLRVRDDNIRFFIAHNVTGIFEQDVYNTRHGELSALSGYLNAKLLWNPEYGEDRAIDEFLEGVYGPAAKPIRQYLKLIHDRVQRKNIHMNIWIGPDGPQLTDALLKKADRLWAQAEAAVKHDAAFLERVRIARLSVDYALIERTRQLGVDAYAVDHNRLTVELQPAFRERVERFFTVAEAAGVTNIRESDGALAKYKELVQRMKPGDTFPLMAASNVRAGAPGLRYRYFEGIWETLPDFTSITPVKEGVAHEIGLEHALKRDEFALEFSGYFRAPRRGIYTFTLRSNDGSQLFIGGQLVVDNNGLHSERSMSGSAALEPGLHPIRVTFFESAGTEALSLLYSGPGISQRPIPRSALLQGYMVR